MLILKMFPLCIRPIGDHHGVIATVIPGSTQQRTASVSHTPMAIIAILQETTRLILKVITIEIVFIIMVAVGNLITIAIMAPAVIGITPTINILPRPKTSKAAL